MAKTEVFHITNTSKGCVPPPPLLQHGPYFDGVQAPGGGGGGDSGTEWLTTAKRPRGAEAVNNKI